VLTPVVGPFVKKFDRPELRMSALRSTLSGAVTRVRAFVGTCATTGRDPMTGTVLVGGVVGRGAGLGSGSGPPVVGGLTTERGAVSGAGMTGRLSVTVGTMEATGAGSVIGGRTGRSRPPSACAEVALASVMPPRNIPKHTVVLMVLFMMMQLQSWERLMAPSKGAEV
jgi:hypothetical protein